MMEISKPSHNFLMVEIVVLWLRPLTMLFSVDCVTPLIVLSLFTVIPLAWHNPVILSLTASPIVNAHPPPICSTLLE